MLKQKLRPLDWNRERHLKTAHAPHSKSQPDSDSHSKNRVRRRPSLGKTISIHQTGPSEPGKRKITIPRSLFISSASVPPAESAEGKTFKSGFSAAGATSRTAMFGSVFLSFTTCTAPAAAENKNETVHHSDFNAISIRFVKPVVLEFSGI